MVWQWMTISIILATSQSGGHPASVDVDDTKCRAELITIMETKYHEVEEEECTNIHKKVPVMVSKLEPRKVCGENQGENLDLRTSVDIACSNCHQSTDDDSTQFNCHTEHVKVWKHRLVELDNKECKTVLKKVPVEVSKLVEKKVCDDDSIHDDFTIYDSVYDISNEDIEDDDYNPPKPIDTIYDDFPIYDSVFDTNDDYVSNDDGDKNPPKETDTIYDSVFDTNYNDNENDVSDEGNDRIPPRSMKLPCWSGIECPSDLVNVVMG